LAEEDVKKIGGVRIIGAGRYPGEIKLDHGGIASKISLTFQDLIVRVIARAQSCGGITYAYSKSTGEKRSQAGP